VLQDAIRTYHDLLTDDLAAEAQAVLEEHQRRCGLAFGNRPLCTVLRPRFLTPEQYGFLRQRVGVLMSAFATAYRAALADAGFRRQFGLLEQEDALLRSDPGFSCPCPTSRLDAFFVSEQELRFTEFNAETPAGAGYNDALGDLFLGLPVMGEFLRRYQVRPLPARCGVLHAVRAAHREWCGRRERPRIGILDWREVPTYSEFLLFQEFFRFHGLECVIADPREVEYRGGKLMAGDFHVTLVYKRVLISELLDRGGLEQPLVRAVRDGAVCMANPFRCKVLYKKASLAVLSDERNGHLFDAAQRRAIAEHIPWTRLVEERRTQYDGRTVDLVPFIHQHRERLVLKPNDDYGGKGIVLGWTVDAAAWEKAVQTALASPHVVQERVNLPSEPFPGVVDGRLQVIDRMLDTAPFVCHGAYVDGCLTRISTAALLNVTAGGGSTVPTFLVEPR
jgi:hypothetical protein